MLPKENIGAFRSQLVDSLGGKLWRIDPDTGAGLPSNPFYDSADPYAPRSRVWAMGLRNPFRFTRRPGVGSTDPADGNPGVFYVGDVGWTRWEDLHIVDAPGLNFGWPIYEGMNLHNSTSPTYEQSSPFNQDAPNPSFGIGTCTNEFVKFSDLIVQDTLGTPDFSYTCGDQSGQLPASLDLFVHSRPAIDWRHGQNNARWAAFNGNDAEAPLIGQTNTEGSWTVAGTPFRGNSSPGGTWYLGNHFPAAYTGTYFHGDYGSQWIRQFVMTANNFPIKVNTFGDSLGGVVGLAEHPQTGKLYYIAWATYLREVSYTGSDNRAPVASFSATPTEGDAPLTVTFDGSASDDPDGTIVSYDWDFGDGSGNGQVTSHEYASAGTYYVTLTITDDDGVSDTSETTAIVVDVPPNSAPIVDAGGNVTGIAGAQVLLSGSVTDDGLPNPPGSVSVAWTVLSGPDVPGVGEPTWPLDDQDQAVAHPVFPQLGTYVLRLSANDSELARSPDITATISGSWSGRLRKSAS